VTADQERLIRADFVDGNKTIDVILAMQSIRGFSYEGMILNLIFSRIPISLENALTVSPFNCFRGFLTLRTTKSVGLLLLQLPRILSSKRKKICY
jgi:hypothetical protein